jgi:hypothetical protein
MLHRYQQARLYAGFYFADCLRPAEKLGATGIKQGRERDKAGKNGERRKCHGNTAIYISLACLAQDNSKVPDACVLPGITPA